MLSAFYFMGELDEKSLVREVLGFVVVALHASFYVVFMYEYISDKTTVEEEDGRQVRRWRWVLSEVGPSPHSVYHRLRPYHCILTSAARPRILLILSGEGPLLSKGMPQ